MIKQEKIDELFEKLDGIVADKYKICNKCKTKKRLSYFGKNASRHDGVTHYCKECTLSYHRSYKKSDDQREKAKLRARKLYKKEKYKKYRKEYYLRKDVIERRKSYYSSSR